MKKLILSVFTLFIVLFLSPNLAKPVQAATFTVNSTTDAVDANAGNGSCATAGAVCTLRAAIQEANALAGDDTINVPAGTFTLSIAGTGEDLSATGDLDIRTNITINGAAESTTIIDANSIDRVMDFPVAATVSISNVTIKNGNISGDTGGGINNSSTASLTLNAVTVTNNTSSVAGGGIYNGATLTITTSSVNNNEVTSGGNGGGIMNTGTMTATYITVKNNTSAIGGGIENDSVLTGTNLLVNNNTAESGAGLYFDSDTTLTNATVTGNTATTLGGGIYIDFGTSTLTNLTIANNTAPSGQGAGIYLTTAFGGAAILKNTLLSANSSDNCHAVGTITSSGHNLSSDSSCSTYFNQSGDLNSTNPMLSSLSDNGGSVYTMALQKGSPAIDGGTNTGCPATDARGTSRPQDGDNNGTATCDIGSYEYIFVSSTSSSSSSALSNSGNFPWLISCSDPTPQGIPDLFQIDVTKTSASLYVNTTLSNTPSYEVFYGLTSDANQYSYKVSNDSKVWISKAIINALQPNTTYYFKVRASTGCNAGLFGKTLKVKTKILGKKSFYKN